VIAYDLQCSHGHQFEGWFEDSAAFERQNRQQLIACPACDDTAISRIPSTFAIKGTSAALPLPSDGKVNMAALGRQIVDYVENHFDNVGSDFAKEALKMHYGVTAPRNIRGVSTSQEEDTLKSEGVKFFKFPMPSEPSETDKS
jgi:hypothetical protein